MFTIVCVARVCICRYHSYSVSGCTNWRDCGSSGAGLRHPLLQTVNHPLYISRSTSYMVHINAKLVLKLNSKYISRKILPNDHSNLESVTQYFVLSLIQFCNIFPAAPGSVYTSLALATSRRSIIPPTSTSHQWAPPSHTNLNDCIMRRRSVRVMYENLLVTSLSRHHRTMIATTDYVTNFSISTFNQ